MSPPDADAMQEGSRIHRKIQKRMGSLYHAEVPLSIVIPAFELDKEYALCIEGRADGIIHSELDEDEDLLADKDQKEQAKDKRDNEEEFSEVTEEKVEEIIQLTYEDIGKFHLDNELTLEEQVKRKVIIDEIKSMYLDLASIQEPFEVHRAQVMFYAYIYAKQQELSEATIRLTYCNIETEATKYFEETYPFSHLEKYFYDIVNDFIKWIRWQCEWKIERDASIKGVEFPFPYREGQRDLVTGVYRSIIRDRKLYIEAPTGVGKTISTVYPTVKSMGEGHTDKIFYMTAKTITRTAAQDTFRLLQNQGVRVKVATITAKDKLCILDKPECNPGACERALGHFDRVNDAVYDLISNEYDITREVILEYAKKHMVCPFEMCLDVTLWSDAIICDYNYVFDPNVYLRRFFANDQKNDYVFLIDEAHNLVERAREMYSAQLFKQHFLDVKKIVTPISKKLAKRLEACNTSMLKMKRECEDLLVLENIGDFVLHLMRLSTEYDEFFAESHGFDEKEKCLDLYFDIRHFLNIYELLDDNYTIYTDYDEKEGFRVRLQCMNPARNILNCLEKGRSAIFFSATLLPIQYYKEQLGGKEDDYAIYAPSPFDVRKRLIMIGKDVSTKYTRRNQREYEKIYEYIRNFTNAKVGNYMVFFPSYQLMKEVGELLNQAIEEGSIQADLAIQQSSMSEREREEFLEEFVDNPDRTRIGLCVMGGIFSEGIDLRANRLIGVVIVGTGLPMVCNERELFRTYYDNTNGNGFDYAYLFSGMNKVLQSAGRVIRTQEDKGAILLLDERFVSSQYQNLFPREWFPHHVTNREDMLSLLTEFWSSDGIE
jgi:Rad3-related DNA helicase